MPEAKFIPLPDYRRYPEEEMIERSRSFHHELDRRRTVRDFSDEAISKEIIENCLRSAGTAPSGANIQPWQFVVVSDPSTKRNIRMAAEKEEIDFYERRTPQEWLDVLAPLGTDPEKAFLEVAPFLIAIFVQSFGLLPDGGQGFCQQR